MIKKIVKFVIVSFLLLLVFAGLFWFTTKTSNTWDAKTVGDIPVLSGYERVEASKGSYADYFRSLPLKKRGAKVQYYTGGDARFQFLSAAVIDQNMLSGFEQCADVTMRLRAEYLWSKGRYNEISFLNINNKRMNYTGGASRKEFEKYMKNVYVWCSTYSMYNETKPRAIKDVKPGDVLVFKAPTVPNFLQDLESKVMSQPIMGHAVIVADVAKNKNGKIAIMCIEGNTPAREKHVIRNPNPFRNPWFVLDEDDNYISIFHFKKDELRHY